MKVNLFKLLLIALISLLYNQEVCYSQYLILPQGDTLMVVSENGTISDISGNYMGKFESDGKVLNGQDILVGKIDYSNGKIFDVTDSEVASFSNNQLLDWDQNLQASITNSVIYNTESESLGSFISIDPLKALFLLIYYF
jgi:hypothetical protein